MRCSVVSGSSHTITVEFNELLPLSSAITWKEHEKSIWRVLSKIELVQAGFLIRLIMICCFRGFTAFMQETN